MRLTSDQCWARMREGERATLCTLNAQGTIDAVPVCFAVVGEVIATPVDRIKPKETTALGRLANLERAAATLLVDHWDGADWSRLWWVRAKLVRRPPEEVGPLLLEDCARALRAKYPPYRDAEDTTENPVFAAVIVLDVGDLTGWAAT
jgi:hypothetical protein